MQNKDLIIIALLVLAIYLYYQNQRLRKLPDQRIFVGTDSSTSQTLFEINDEEDKENLIADRDQAIRDKNEMEQENISLANKLQLKNQEVSRKEQEIQRLKDEKSKVEIALNKKLTDLKEKHSKQGQLLDEEQLENNKLTEKIEKLEGEKKELETERTKLLTEISKHDDLDAFQSWLSEKEENKANLPDWDKILGEIKAKISDYHLQPNNWASGLLTRNTKYWQVFKNWLEEND